MIWLFKVDEVFWNNKPKVNEFYTFNTDDIHFDITQYNMSLYFPMADYYILNDSNEADVYQLRLEAVNKNPTRILIPNNCEIYGIVKDFYETIKNNKQ